jgi:hypothetical protein
MMFTIMMTTVVAVVVVVTMKTEYSASQQDRP